jgi:hypothetical protein
MVSTNTSSTCTLNWRARKMRGSTGLQSTSQVLHPPNSSPMLVSVLLKPSKSACKLPSPLHLQVPFRVSMPSLGRRALPGECTIIHNQSQSIGLTWQSLYKGLYPLWGRQIPYTMMKFASFETIVEAIYNYLPGTKHDYGKAPRLLLHSLLVTWLVFCALLSLILPMSWSAN